jgi:hypothetical protein
MAANVGFAMGDIPPMLAPEPRRMRVLVVEDEPLVAIR